MKKWLNISSKIVKMTSVFIVVSGYVFFLASYYIIGTASSDNFTELNTPIEFESSRFVTIKRWDYSVKQNMMEIELFFDNQVFDDKNKYIFSSLIKIKGSYKDVELKEVFKEENHYVLHFIDIPSDWEEISLRFRMKDEDTRYKLYSSKNVIYKVNKIDSLDKKGYIILNFNREIEILENEIDERETLISDLEKKISNIDIRNEELNNDLTHQFGSEKEKTESNIKQNQTKKDGFNQNILDYNLEIEERNNKIAHIKTQISETEGSDS